MSGRTLLLDDCFPLSLASELRARGRPAVHVREADLAAASDEHLASRAHDATLVTCSENAGARVAVVIAPDDAARREIVHRFAHEMAVQRAGFRRYRGGRGPGGRQL
jgi:hypothetical protein